MFPCPLTRLRIWSRDTGSAVPSRVSLLILHTQADAMWSKSVLFWIIVQSPNIQTRRSESCPICAATTNASTHCTTSASIRTLDQRCSAGRRWRTSTLAITQAAPDRDRLVVRVMEDLPRSRSMICPPTHSLL